MYRRSASHEGMNPSLPHRYLPRLWGVALILGLGAVTTAAQDVQVAIRASRPTIRAGEQVEFTVTAINHGAEAVWTNPSIICTGSWDFIVRDAGGRRVRVDDRDAMGCPSGGLLSTRIEPGAQTTVTLGWDGRVREHVGRASDAPRGPYEIEVTVRWADRAETPNHAGPHVFTSSDRLSVMVRSDVKPPPVPGDKPVPPPPPPAPPPLRRADDLRARLAAFEPPENLVVTTTRGPVTMALQDFNAAQVALRTAGTESARARIRSDFEQIHGVALAQVSAALGALRRAHQERIVSELARPYGITRPRLISWGPAGSALGIQGFIDGEPVLLYQGKIYRRGERPENFFSK